MSDLYTEAWAEAVASCPTDQQPFCTVELQHPAFLEDGSLIPLRFVAAERDMSFGIEMGATFDAGEMAVFRACAFTAEYPEVAEGRVPSSRIAVDNVARDLTEYLNDAVRVRADLAMIYREYLPDDLSEPSYGPVRFRVAQVDVNGARVEGLATLRDLTNSRVPLRTYTRALFPGLVQT